MSLRLLLISVFGAALLAGCRKDPYMQVYIDNMNAEKRLLEDTLYELQYDYEDKLSEVATLKKELNELKTGGGSSVLQPGSGSPATGSSSGGDDLFPAIPDLKPPTIEEGTTPKNAEPGILDDPDGLEPPKLELGNEADGISAAPRPLNQQITQLYLNPALTGGHQRDDKAGDDGITVVFEPRDRNNNFVRVPGRVTVVVLDPEDRTRIARWEFDEQQTATALQKARTGKGIELNMPWKERPPEKNRLHLFVRYWLPDGRAVQEDREITVTPAGQVAARWTPRSTPRSSPSRERIDMAENPGSSDPKSTPSNSIQSTKPAPSTGSSDAPVGGAAAKQANRPEWRPYR